LDVPPDDRIAYTGILHRTAYALAEIGGRPVVDAVLDRLRWGPPNSDPDAPDDRQFTPLPDEDVYVLTWVLAESIGRTPARGAVDAVLAEVRAEEPWVEADGGLTHLLLASRLLDPRHELKLRGFTTSNLPARVRQALRETAEAAAD
jgi:hypothetical protein